MSTDSLLIVLTLLAGLFMTWSIGANDVANAVGTSVGSKALTMRQAVILAAILEFFGALLFGAHVTSTIQEGVLSSSLLKSDPLLIAIGMLSVLLGAGSWLFIASYFGLPVSTTHSIVGAMAGFGVVAAGLQAVEWGNVVYIASSWVLSPLFGGVLSYAIFSLIRRSIFFSINPKRSALTLAPYLAALIALIFSIMVTYQKNPLFEHEPSLFKTLLYSLLFSLAMFLFALFYFKRCQPSKEATFSLQVADFQFVERLFNPLQVLTAAMMAFAHGANDVANAIGPLALAFDALLGKETVPYLSTLLLALGGFGIVLGVTTWGWRVIETIGNNLTELTPTRGFSAEFGAATTILLASRLGLPISSTHTLVGAVLGVGFARGIGTLNLKTLREIVFSWLVTIPIGAIGAILYFLLIRSFFSEV